jgi:hypothetical protein
MVDEMVIECSSGETCLGLFYRYCGAITLYQCEGCGMYLAVVT